MAFGHSLARVYSPDEQVIQYSVNRLQIIGKTYFVCGMMDTMVGGLRGIGCSLIPMFVSLTGACAFRVVWIFTVFAMDQTLQTLYVSYPVSWAITFAAHVVCYLVVRQRMKKKGGWGQ